MAVPEAGAAETIVPPEVGSMLGLRSTRLIQIDGIVSSAETTGEWRRGMNELADLARSAQDSGDHTTQVEAELAWVKLASREGGEADMDEALDELVSRARDWGLPRQEAQVFIFWAERLEDDGDWLMALRALDAAVQASLGDGLVNDGLRTLLQMSRLCRENGHPWRLQQIWVRIRQVEAELDRDIDTAVREALEAERADSAFLLSDLTTVTAARPPRVDLQPSRAVVMVSSTHGEVGRARYFLTNETVRTVTGSLKIESRTGAVKKWETGQTGHWLTLGPADAAAGAVPVPAAKEVSLRPGERVSVYVEREQPAANDLVNLTWSGSGGEVTATGEFLFSGSQPESSVVNAGSLTVRPGWNVPLYHEINYRGPGMRPEDFQFETSVPCRLEIFDVDGGRFPAVDAGKLLAVDAEGDGCFHSDADQVQADANGDGNPDISIGDRTRSLEILAWPLVPLPDGSELTVSARLKRPGTPGAWRTDAENIVAAPPKPVAKIKRRRVALPLPSGRP